MQRFLIASLKVIGALVLVAAVFFYVVVNHSETREELLCRGHWNYAPSESETAYVRLNEYRWWVRLWSNSHGNAEVQTDKRALVEYFPEVIKTGDGRLAIYVFHRNGFRGGYRAANGEITIEFLANVVFIGSCSP